jgi:SAM-dependent methyltransferase
MSASSPEQRPEAPENEAATYNRFYRQPNYFQYRDWLYRPFIRALIKAAGLKRGSRVLDVGCGQGFFTALFADEGMDSLGADISAEGVAQARNQHGKSGAKFEVGSALQLPYGAVFDCVFSRSCSLYNRADFVDHRVLTEALLGYVRPGGVLIFDYNTKLCAWKKSSRWRYHSLDEARRHFSPYANSRVCFSLRFDTLLLGHHAFGFTGLNALASRLSGVGGELVALVRKN